jgi:hypothetical protein
MVTLKKKEKLIKRPITISHLPAFRNIPCYILYRNAGQINYIFSPMRTASIPYNPSNHDLTNHDLMDIIEL